MTKKKKIWLGVFTFLPILLLIFYFISFIGIFFGIFSSIQDGGEPDPAKLIGGFATAFLFVFLAILASVGIMIYYIIHISNNKMFDSNQRLMWILIIVFTGMIGNCIYWGIYIWKDNKLT